MQTYAKKVKKKIKYKNDKKIVTLKYKFNSQIYTKSCSFHFPKPLTTSGDVFEIP